MKAPGLAQGKLEKPSKSMLKSSIDGTLHGYSSVLQSARNVVAAPEEMPLGPATLLRKFRDFNLGLYSRNPQKPTKELAKC